MKAVHQVTRLLVLALLATIVGVSAQQPDALTRFTAVDIFIDSQEPLAAWQFELAERNGLMTVVGVENGNSNAFPEAPYFDLDALRLGTADRVIVADFSLEPTTLLPSGRTRVATIHVQLVGGQDPDYELSLIAAGGVDGDAIEAQISLDTQ